MHTAVIPMDETLTRVAIDVSNRPYLIWKVKLKVEKTWRDGYGTIQRVVSSIFSISWYYTAC